MILYALKLESQMEESLLRLAKLGARYIRWRGLEYSASVPEKATHHLIVSRQDIFGKPTAVEVFQIHKPKRTKKRLPCWLAVDPAGQVRSVSMEEPPEGSAFAVWPYVHDCGRSSVSSPPDPQAAAQLGYRVERGNIVLR